MINVSVDARGLDLAQKVLKSMPQAFKKAESMSVKRAMNAMRTATVRGIRETYNAKAGRVRDSIRPLSITGGGGQLRVTGHRLFVSEFKMSPHSRPKKQHGLRVAVRKDHSPKLIPKAFLMAPHGGREMPFIRVGKRRGQVKPIFTLAVPQMLNNPDIQEAIVERGEEAFTKSMKYLLGQAIKKG